MVLLSHTAWWSKLWRRSGVVDIEVADNLPNGWNIWMKWETTAKASGLWGRNGDLELLTAVSHLFADQPHRPKQSLAGVLYFGLNLKLF